MLILFFLEIYIYGSIPPSIQQCKYLKRNTQFYNYVISIKNIKMCVKMINNNEVLKN